MMPRRYCSHFSNGLPFWMSILEDGGESCLGGAAGHFQKLFPARSPMLALSSHRWALLKAIVLQVCGMNHRLMSFLIWWSWCEKCAASIRVCSLTFWSHFNVFETALTWCDRKQLSKNLWHVTVKSREPSSAEHTDVLDLRLFRVLLHTGCCIQNGKHWPPMLNVILSHSDARAQVII